MSCFQTAQTSSNVVQTSTLATFSIHCSTFYITFYKMSCFQTAENKIIKVQTSAQITFSIHKQQQKKSSLDNWKHFVVKFEIQIVLKTKRTQNYISNNREQEKNNVQTTFTGLYICIAVC